MFNNLYRIGPGNPVCTATYYGTVRDRIPVRTRFSVRPDRPWGPSSVLYNGYRVFPGGRGGRGVGLTPHPHLVQKVLKRVPLFTLRTCLAYLLTSIEYRVVCEIFCRTLVETDRPQMTI